MEIKHFLGEDYLKNFKLFFRETLFEPDWEALKIDRCPICSNKLKFLRNGRSAICGGKRHKKPFIISKERLDKIKFDH